MRTFFAVLKDSFREAVDGFVIYIMLALAVLTIIFVASISYHPVGTDPFLGKSIKSFVIFVPDKGQAKAISGVGGLEYQATGAKVNGTDVLFDLEVVKKPGPFDGLNPKMAAFHPIRGAVAGWLKKPYKSEKVKLPAAILRGGGGDTKDDGAMKELETALQPDISPEDIQAVTDEQVIDFLKNQFAVHYGCNDVRIRKRDSGDANKYVYEVEAIGLTTSRGWAHDVGVLFGVHTFKEVQLGSAVHVVLDSLVNGIGGAILLLISVILTSFFIPNMLRKGTLDLVVSKPVGKVQYLLYKYVGGLIFIAIISTIAIGGVWLMTGIRSGIFDPRFLITIPALILTFALLYSFSTLIGVLTRNAIAAMLLTIFFAFLLWLIGQLKSTADLFRAMGQDGWETPGNIIDFINNASPRYKDLDKLTSKIIGEGVYTPIMLRFQDLIVESPSYFATIGITLLYIGLFLGLASWRHATRDG